MSLKESLKAELNVAAPHHAYLIVGERGQVIPELKTMLEVDGFAIQANADFHLYELDVFLIEHAHQLRREQAMHASQGSRKIFVVAFNTIISEAQNALLKTLEEPTEGTKFFFITRNSEVLLPTVRSRMQVIHMQEEETNLGSKDLGVLFLAASIPERLKQIERYTKAKTDDKPRAKEEARVFLIALERATYAKGEEARYRKALEDILTAKRFLSDRSPSVKLLLEHLALTVPVCS